MVRRKRFEALVLIGVLLLGAIVMGVVSTTIASGQATATEAVHFSKLIPFLPAAPSGWEGEEPEGMTFTYEDGTWSMATKSYSKSGTEDVTADVGITDYAFYTAGWSAAWQVLYAYESTEGYAKTVTVKGLPAWEIYDKDTNDYSLYISINDRFLALINTNSNKDTLYDFANSMDYKGIAALGGGKAAAGEEPGETPSEEYPTGATEVPEDGGKAPGFEAVFAVAGLLAVLYLLRRRG